MEEAPDPAELLPEEEPVPEDPEEVLPEDLRDFFVDFDFEPEELPEVLELLAVEVSASEDESAEVPEVPASEGESAEVSEVPASVEEASEESEESASEEAVSGSAEEPVSSSLPV